MKSFTVIFCAALLSACSLLNEDKEQRTLPHAQNLDLVLIKDLNQTVPLPGSYNIRGYVVSVTKCPEKALCILPDGISLYEFDAAEPTSEELRENGIFIAIEDPDQFRVGRRYEISVSIDHERFPEASWPFSIILGYDLIR